MWQRDALSPVESGLLVNGLALCTKLIYNIFSSMASFHLCVNRGRKSGKACIEYFVRRFPVIQSDSERSQQRVLKFLEEQMMKRGDLQLCTISSNA